MRDLFGLIYFGMLVLMGGFGIASLSIAITFERRMQRHRQPGVGYWDVTLRRDGAWKRADLFTQQGLQYQGKAAKWGMIGGASLIVGLILLFAIPFLPKG